MSWVFYLIKQVILNMSFNPFIICFSRLGTSCHKICPEKTYGDDAYMLCSPCDDYCINCDESQCYLCEDDFFLSGAKECLFCTDKLSSVQQSTLPTCETWCSGVHLLVGGVFFVILMTLMSLVTLLALAQWRLTGDKMSVISNVRDNGQILPLASKSKSVFSCSTSR